MKGINKTQPIGIANTNTIPRVLLLGPWQNWVQYFFTRHQSSLKNTSTSINTLCSLTQAQHVLLYQQQKL